MNAKRSTRRAATQRTMEHGAPSTRTCREQSCRFFLEVLVAFSLWYATRSFPGLSVARVVPPFFDDIDEVFSTDAACASPGAALEGEGFLALGRSTSHCSTVLLKVTSKLPRKGLLLSLVFAASPTVVSTASWPLWCPRLFRLSCGTVYNTPAPAQSLKSSWPASFPGYFPVAEGGKGKSRLPSRRGEGTGHFVQFRERKYSLRFCGNVASCSCSRFLRVGLLSASA